MLHELIMALIGFEGDLFPYNGTAFQIVNQKEIKVPLLHPSESAVISQVLEIATHYKQLCEFVKSTQLIGLSYTTEEEDTNRTGLPISRSYLSSIAYGIKPLLQNYVEVISDLESKILNDLGISFTHIRSVCEPFRGLFLLLHSFMIRIKHEKSTCRLLDILKEVYDHNIHYWDILTPLVVQAQVPLYKHLTEWVVFGSLPSPNPEFFIQLSKEEPETINQDNSMGRSRIKIPTSKRPQHHFINYTLVPSHFPPRLTEMILFMGSSMIILEKSQRTRTELMEKQKEFLAQMRTLPKDTFRTTSLLETMENLSAAVGKDLHRLVMIDANLLSHLSVIKDFHLGGRGEFLYAFLINISENLAKKTSLMDLKMLTMKNVRLDIKECFHLAATRVQLQEDILQKIEVVVITDPTKTDIMDKYLTELRLNVKQEWPLHILFSPESMSGYNELFQFLLHIRRVHFELKTIWAETKSIFRVPIPNGPAILRININYFVNNFQYYLQADVLENQYAVLVETIEKSDTFDQIKIALAKFQTNIMVQSFRTNPALREGIQQMLELCGKYCKHMTHLLENYEKNGIPVCEGRSPVMDEFTSDFNRRMEFLYASFRRLAGDPQFGVYLGQLLLRLDYNSYFSNFSNISHLTKGQAVLDGSSIHA